MSTVNPKRKNNFFSCIIDQLVTNISVYGAENNIDEILVWKQYYLLLCLKFS